jgi:NAD/NADP transhydrogenase alpha subunit
LHQDEAYADAGARVAGAKEALGSDVVLKVQPPSPAEVEQLKEHARCVRSVWHGGTRERVLPCTCGY